jgi:hypothetical protein
MASAILSFADVPERANRGLGEDSQLAPARAFVRCSRTADSCQARGVRSR